MKFDERSSAAAGVDGLLDGRYRLGDVLGRGGVATVYAAVDVVLGREVAVKMFRPVESRVALYRFAAEARLLAGLSHSGLVTVHDVSLDGDRPYLVMQLVAGDTLRQLMDLGPMEPALVAQIGARVADVLAYVHSRDIVHRDVKPSNVLVDDCGDCFLADFGIARALGAAHFTGSGELVGTAAYLAPEQVTDVDTGPKADVYALGLVLLECLNGEPEYTGTTVEAAVARLSRQPRVPETYSPRWRALLAEMTAQDPAERPDAARCAGLLDEIARNPGEPTAGTVAPTELQIRRTRVRPPLARPLLARPLPAGLGLAALAGAVAVGIAAAPTSIAGVPVGTEPAARPPVERTEAVTGPVSGHRQTAIPVAPVANEVTATPDEPPARPAEPAEPNERNESNEPDEPNRAAAEARDQGGPNPGRGGASGGGATGKSAGPGPGRGGR